MSSNWRLSGFADEAGMAIDTQIDTTVKAGLDMIDLRMLEGKSIADYDPETAKPIKAKLDEAGLTVGMFGSPIGKIDLVDDFQTDVDRLKRLAALAPVFDCNKVRIFSYFNEGKTPSGPASPAPEDKYQAIAFERLGELKKLAAELGVILYSENERDIYGDTVKHNLEIAEAFRDGDTFRMIFDFDNYNQMGEDVWQAWEVLKPHTDAFHLKESDSNNQHVPMGEGAGYNEKIFADCKASGWTGHLALEPHLAHSDAVMATGPGGEANQSLSSLDEVEAWLVGAKAAKGLLSRTMD